MLISDVDTGIGISGMFEFDCLVLTVTEAPMPTGRIGDLENKLIELRDELDGKMDAWIGYVQIILTVALLSVVIVLLVCKNLL